MPEQAQEGVQEHGRQQHDPKQRRYRLVAFAVMGVLIIAAIGFIIASQSEVGKVARLQVDREMIDFGDQHLGTIVRASFKITNVGDGTLSLNVPRTPTVVEGC